MLELGETESELSGALLFNNLADLSKVVFKVGKALEEGLFAREGKGFEGRFCKGCETSRKRDKRSARKEASVASNSASAAAKAAAPF